MYNTKYAAQMEKFRKHLFGSANPRTDDAYQRYSLPPGVKLVECYEDDNGEWVPKPESLEGKVEE